MTPTLNKTHDTRLSDVRQGEEVTLSTVRVSLELTSRLTSLGLTPGVLLKVLQNYGRGPIIVNVRGTHVALGRGEADKILVELSGGA
jgi:ferrous iron transport protein A